MKSFELNVEAIYEAGYRKAEEVRKETAKEIFSWLYGQIKMSNYGILLLVSKDIKAIAKQYGVEVDE